MVSFTELKNNLELSRTFSYVTKFARDAICREQYCDRQEMLRWMLRLKLSDDDDVNDVLTYINIVVHYKYLYVCGRARYNVVKITICFVYNDLEVTTGLQINHK